MLQFAIRKLDEKSTEMEARSETDHRIPDGVQEFLDVLFQGAGGYPLAVDIFRAEDRDRGGGGRKAQLLGEVILGAGTGHRHIQAEKISLRLAEGQVIGQAGAVIEHAIHLGFGHQKSSEPVGSELTLFAG